MVFPGRIKCLTIVSLLPARYHSIVMSDIAGDFFSRSRQLASYCLMSENALRAVAGVAGLLYPQTFDKIEIAWVFRSTP